MSQALDFKTPTREADIGPFMTTRPAYHAYLLLYAGFVVLPIVAGADKFLHMLCDWGQYLAPAVTNLLPVTGHTFMQVAGIIEIAAGILVAFRPRVGAAVVTLWLWGICVDLILSGGFYDIALRDFGLSLGALALMMLCRDFD